VVSGPARNVPLCLADIDEADVARVAEVVRSGWLTTGVFNDELEERFAATMGVRHAVSVNSCASALHLALLALRVRGEVILPSFTFVATANAVVTAGATPVFAEIDPGTCNLDPAAVEAAITPRTEAIMPVHFAGQPCDMPALMDIARRHGLAVVEDSAQSIGAEIAGRKAGTFGVGCYSFYPTKNMTTGEGGMLVTDDERLAETVRTYAGHGVPSTPLARDRDGRPWQRAATLPGYNLRMSNMHAALGVGQLARLDDMNARRRAHAVWYDAQLADCPQLELPVRVPGATHVFQMYTLKVVGADRDRFVLDLRRHGVGASVHFDPPVHRQPYYAALARDAPLHLPVTDRVAGSICTLPLFPGMTEDQLVQVRNGVRQAVALSAAP
jgi:perosamine synthetase